MPASHTGFGSFFLDGTGSLPPGYRLQGYRVPGYRLQGYRVPGYRVPGYRVPVLGGPTGVHLVAGVPLNYTGILPEYHVITNQEHMTLDLKSAPPFQPLLARGPPYYPGAPEEPGRVRAASRESTGPLKAWLNEHRKNPYPSKGEKVMLALVSRMSLTQVSTWFANARRRLKKENRVSWTRTGQQEEQGESEEEQEEEEERRRCPPEEEEEERSTQQPIREQEDAGPTPGLGTRTSAEGRDSVPVQKARIWSLVETATSGTPGTPGTTGTGTTGTPGTPGTTGTPGTGSRSDSLYLPGPGPVGRVWADWTSRTGMLVPSCYCPAEIV